MRSQCDRCRLGAILGCDLSEVEGVIWVLGSPTKSKGAIWVRFEVEVEVVFYEVQKTAKLKGAKSKGSRLWVRGVIWVWSLSLSLCVWVWKWFEVKIFTSNHFWVKAIKTNGQLKIFFEKFRACLGNHFSSLNFRHSISITHHSSLITHHSSLIFSHSFGNITFIFITQFFHTIHGSHTYQPVQFFFFFLVPNSPKLI